MREQISSPERRPKTPVVNIDKAIATWSSVFSDASLPASPELTPLYINVLGGRTVETKNSSGKDIYQVVCVYIGPEKKCQIPGKDGKKKTYFGGNNGSYAYVAINNNERITLNQEEFSTQYQLAGNNTFPDAKHFVHVTSEGTVFDIPGKSTEVRARFNTAANGLKQLAEVSDREKKRRIQKYKEFLDEKRISVTTLETFTSHFVRFFQEKKQREHTTRRIKRKEQLYDTTTSFQEVSTLKESRTVSKSPLGGVFVLIELPNGENLCLLKGANGIKNRLYSAIMQHFIPVDSTDEKKINDYIKAYNDEQLSAQEYMEVEMILDRNLANISSRPPHNFLVDVPGGGIEPKETPKLAGMREGWEEVKKLITGSGRMYFVDREGNQCVSNKWLFDRFGERIPLSEEEKTFSTPQATITADRFMITKTGEKIILDKDGMRHTVENFPHFIRKSEFDIEETFGCPLFLMKEDRLEQVKLTAETYEITDQNPVPNTPSVGYRYKVTEEEAEIISLYVESMTSHFYTEPTQQAYKYRIHRESGRALSEVFLVDALMLLGEAEASYWRKQQTSLGLNIKPEGYNHGFAHFATPAPYLLMLMKANEQAAEELANKHIHIPENKTPFETWLLEKKKAA